MSGKTKNSPSTPMRKTKKNSAEKKSASKKPILGSKKAKTGKKQISSRRQARKDKAYKNWFMKIMVHLFAIAFFVFVSWVIVDMVRWSANPIDTAGATVYDTDGQSMGSIIGNGGEWQSLDTIPETTKNAFIAVEDSRFYYRIGIDLARFTKAITSKGEAGGGSTITSQILKNTYLAEDSCETGEYDESGMPIIDEQCKTREKIKRKIAEIPGTFAYDLIHSKDEVLETYLNTIFLGSDAYGISDGALYYFGVEASQLTLPESAYLAGLPQAPNSYNVYYQPEKAQERYVESLGLLYQHGYINDFEYNAAMEISVAEIAVPGGDQVSGNNDAALDVVEKELSAKYGLEPVAGMKIYSTIDTESQQILNETINSQDYSVYGEDFQIGSAIIDNDTGAIQAVYGGIGYQSGDFNYAYDLVRQPGSTMKPIMPYAPAIEYMGWGTGTLIYDEPLKYSGSDQVVVNSDSEYMGAMTMREAIVHSRNPTAVYTMQELLATQGSDKTKQIANDLGIIFPYDNAVYESYALGSFDGVNPIQMAGAYAAFANGGVYNEPYIIEKIVMPDGEEIVHEPDPVQAMSEETAWMIGDMLTDVVASGTGAQAQIPGISWQAGKTGSTSFDQETKDLYGYSDKYIKDIWFDGVTENYTMSIWTGYSQNGPDNYLTTDMYKVSRYLYADVMSQILAGESSNQPAMPAGVQAVQLCHTNYQVVEDASECSGKVTTEYFKEGEVNTNSDLLIELSSLSFSFGNGVVSWSSVSGDGITYQVQFFDSSGNNISSLETSSTSANVPSNAVKVSVTAYNGDGKAVSNTSSVSFTAGLKCGSGQKLNTSSGKCDTVQSETPPPVEETPPPDGGGETPPIDGGEETPPEGGGEEQMAYSWHWNNSFSATLNRYFDLII